MEAAYTYTQESRAQTSVTTVGKDGSHLHVSDLHIVAESAHAWNAKGKEVPAGRQGRPVPPTGSTTKSGTVSPGASRTASPTRRSRTGCPPPSRSPPAPGRTCSRR
ncbi:hypothetical protein SCALM49S_05945 [Streptomyces californicus]